MVKCKKIFEIFFSIVLVFILICFFYFNELAAVAECGAAILAKFGVNWAQRCLDTTNDQRVKEEFMQSDDFCQHDLDLNVTNFEEIESDDKLALEWLTKMAEQGDAEAQLKLGMRYKIGRGTEPDIKKAAEWYTKAAEQGNDTAIMLLNLLKDEKIMTKPIETILEEARQGVMEAEHELARRYAYGEGIEENKEKSFEWYARAASHGDLKASTFAFLYIDFAKQSFSKLNEEANNGNKVSQRELAFRYYVGLGVKQNTQKAVEFYVKAAELGDVFSQRFLGDYYSTDEIGEFDLKKSIKWWFKAAEQGSAEAQYSLGRCYMKGQGVLQNDMLAASYFAKAAEQGLAEAQSDLGWCYDHGRGVQQNYKTAIKWYKKAAIQGDAVAQCNLGYIYLEGKGVEKDINQSYIWYKKSADGGFEKAKIILKCFEKD